MERGREGMRVERKVQTCPPGHISGHLHPSAPCLEKERTSKLPVPGLTPRHFRCTIALLLEVLTQGSEKSARAGRISQEP